MRGMTDFGEMDDFKEVTLHGALLLLIFFLTITSKIKCNFESSGGGWLYTWSSFCKQANW